MGGGTPSILTTRQLERLLDELHEITGFREAAAESTMECNPESLSGEKAAGLRALGITRVTVGLQSLRPDLLRLLGRPHGVEEGLAAARIAREAGFRSVGVDLIHAVPGQTVLSWEEDLGRVLDEGVNHVSAYCLSFEEETPFGTWLAEGRLTPLAEEEELAFLQATRTRLREAGLPPYEVSNYAANGHQCAHNINYWRNGDHVGIGPSAASKVDQTRSGNPRSIGAWRASVQSGRFRPAWQETLPPAERLGETWWLGLRMAEGVAPDEARATAGFDLGEDPAVRLARELARDGWLEGVGERWRLTERGLPVADALAARFLEACRAAGEGGGVGEADETGGGLGGRRGGPDLPNVPKDTDPGDAGG